MFNSFDGINFAYKSICNGYSEYPDLPGVFVKHFNSFDISESGDYYDQALNHYKNLDAKTESEILEIKKKSGEWSEEEEKKIERIRFNIQNMRDKRGKASIESQLDEIDKIILEYQNELFPLLSKKNRFFINSAERFADTAVTDFILSIALFQDKELKKPLFSLSDIEYFTEEETYKYVSIYKDLIGSLNYDKMKKVSVCPRYFSFFKNSANAESFFGKCGKDLTQNQVVLFDVAKYFQKLLEHISDITEEERGDPDAIERLFILSQNAVETPDSNLRANFNKAKNFKLQ